MPELSSAEVARMHSENAARANKQDERMQRIEDRQEKHLELITAFGQTLARIDERTKKYDDHNVDIEELKSGYNKLKGFGIAGSFLLGALEGIHMLWGFFRGK